MRKLFLYLLISFLLLPCAAGAEIIINELMAANAVFVDNESYDWVELYNNGNERVALGGWYLSDSLENWDIWAFPEEAYIEAGGYLLIYCAGDDVQGADKNAYYTGYALSSDGEAVVLSNPQGVRIASVSFDAQYGNVSYGIPSGSQEYLFLSASTPGKENTAEGYAVRAQSPVFETAAGFYEGSVSVSIKAETEIHYTLDGSEPTESSTLYENAISITKTAVVRARAFADGMLPSQTTGGTYFIDDPSPVAVISISTDDKYLYSTRQGIMVKGSGAVSNFVQDWQYPAQIEYFDTDGVRQIAQIGTISLAGHSSRVNRQKSFSLYARSALGNDTFDYEFFGNRDYGSYQSLLLRAANSDAKSTRLRDSVISELSEGLGLFYQAGVPVVVYINGVYYGHSNLREKANKNAVAQWEGITDEDRINDIDILEGTGMEANNVLNGSNADWIALAEFCEKNDLNVPENLAWVTDRIDVDSLYNYVIFCMTVNMYDAGNVRIYRVPDGKWKFMLHDVECGLMNTDTECFAKYIRKLDAAPNAFQHKPLAALLLVPEMKDLFLKRFAEIIESNFLFTTQSAPVINKWYEALDLIIVRHIEKYRLMTYSAWKTNICAVYNSARIRPRITVNWIIDSFNLTDAEAEFYFGKTLELLSVYNAKP